MNKVIKDNDSVQDFCLDKIVRAVTKANNSVPEKDRMNEETIQKVVSTVQKSLAGFSVISVNDIHDLVEKALVRHNKYAVSKAYMIYRENKRTQKKFNEIESKALSIVKGDTDLRGENANKNIDDNGAKRDYFAGLVSKSITNKILPKSVLELHRSGKGHFHDADYHLNPEHNCDLLDIENCFTYGFKMQNTQIKPTTKTPFRTACNLLAQINLIVSGRQYGGQTVSWIHLVPFVNYSRNIIRNKIIEDFAEEGINLTEEALAKKVERKLHEEIYEGIKTYQYQILSHSSSNGQTPFVSNNLCLREAETEEELRDLALIIEELFKRRYKGVKDDSGHYITPLFPKFLYWLSDGLNLKKGDPYYYLTELAAKCEVKRKQPDINSEKKGREIKKGQIIPSMGCRSWLAPIWEENTYNVYDIEKCYVKGESAGTQNIDDITDFNAVAYPYGTFIDKQNFATIPDGEYCIGEYRVNFRGNTGWVLRKHGENVVILEPKVYGRWNNGVFTINLPYVALEARSAFMDDLEARKAKFYEILDERLEICREALRIRYKHCSEIKAKNSAILWMHGALARLSAEETVGELMERYPQRASISLGYVGLFETCQALIGQSNTTKEGQMLSIEILNYLNNRLNEWKAEDHIGYSLYGTPEESLTYKFAKANRKEFGVIEHITDKDYVVNSYHVDPRETIDAFTKLEIEGKYLALSSGGAVSYVETPDLSKNLDVVIAIMQWMYDHIAYAEINGKIGVCYACGYEGDIPLIKTHNGKFVFKCPHCGNTNDELMYIIARLCGYLGEISGGNTNEGRLDDIYHRTINVDCKNEIQ